MKQMTALFMLLGIAGVCFAQGKEWHIKLNRKMIAESKTETSVRSSYAINKTEWNKKGTLEIVFTEPNADNWSRSFIFCDSADTQLLRVDSVHTTKLPLSRLRELFKSKDCIYIYTVAIPTDPELAKRVRVGRVHLATLEIP